MNAPPDLLGVSPPSPDNQMFQYFITVVPTKLHTYKVSADTHQFAVTEQVSVCVYGTHTHTHAHAEAIIRVSFVRIGIYIGHQSAISE